MILRCGALKTEVLDTVGAGDCFNGAFVAALASATMRATTARWGGLGASLVMSRARRSGAWASRACGDPSVRLSHVWLEVAAQCGSAVRL